MKILYVGTERGDAQDVATALRGIVNDGAVSWASRIDQATKWVDENRDLAALVLDARANGGSWSTVLKHARGLAPRPAVVVIVPEESGAQPEALGPEADGYVTRNASLSRDLPLAVTRAIARARGSAPEPARASSETQAAATTTGGQAQIDALLRLERAARAEVEQKLEQATSALQEAEQRHRAAMVAASEQLAERQVQCELATARATATWAMVDEQLRTAALEVERARQDQTSAAAEVERLSRRDSELSSRLAETAAARDAFERRLADAEKAVEAANARTEHERRAAAEQLAERQRELQAQIAHEAAARLNLEDRLAQAASALDEAAKRHASAMAGASAHAREVEEALRLAEQDLASTAAELERLARRGSELTSMLAEATTGRSDLERRLAATEAAFEESDTRATRERLAASKKAAEREAELDGQIRQERSARAALEQSVADAEAALRDTQRRHDTALADAAARLAEREAQFDREQSRVTADRDRLAHRLSEVEATLDQVRHDHHSSVADVARLKQHETDLMSQMTAVASQLADAQAVRDILERQLVEAGTAIGNAARREAELEEQIRQQSATRGRLEQAVADGETALRDALQRHDAALKTASDELAGRQARFDRELSQAAADRDRLSQRLAEVESTLDQSRRDLESATGDVARLTQRETDLTSRLSDVSSQLAESEAARHDVERRLAEAADAIRDADERAARDRADAAAREKDLEARLARELDARGTLERALAETRSAALDAERSFREEADALRAHARELEARFGVQFAQERLEHESRVAELQESNAALALERDALQQSLTAIQQQLREQLAAADRERDAATRRMDALQAEADKLSRLVKERDESRAESRRLFQQSALAIFRCTRDGALTDANRAGLALVGRRTTDELRGAQFASAVFEDPNGLSWLIERCLHTRTKESIETTWRRKDGGSLFVRLSAYAPSPDAIEIFAEDLTRLRVLQERLGQAHRMEAVGRIASEVAVTCGDVLSDMRQTVRESLMTAGGNGASRQQGERLLDEVARATSLLRQLAAYGEEQARTPTTADLNTVIRDLGPVLKRVAGDDVEVQLPDASASLTVDVGTERVERLLVNLASYGRERMPFGGRLKIELGTVVVDRRFAAKHPNVRLGLHALVTVTESRRAARADGLLHVRDGKPADGTSANGVPKRGVDFGALQALVDQCGGHLWMTVQPPGDMVAKIRLPLLTSHEQPVPRALAARGIRERTITRWFQH